MKINKIKIENFRKLADIEFDCKDSINTIVGPNGVGKSTIIDAIRLIKAILLPTYEGEAQTTMQNMGIYVPQHNSVLFSTICSDPTKETIIKLEIFLSDKELDLVNDKVDDFALSRLQTALALVNANRLSLISYLSTPIGKSQFENIKTETQRFIKEFREAKKDAVIELTISANQMRGKNGFDQELTSFILKNAPSSLTLFSVFPADRSFPTGDVNIQLGQGDLQQQNLSYSIQPNLKFSRLKNNIVNQLLLGGNNVESLKNDFDLIFQNLMPGKELAGISIDASTNKLTVLIKEIGNQSIYDIDFLSSGEKGLLLTVFLLIRTVAKYGIVIIDEPELHLNPAICKNIIKFFKTHIVEKNNVQILLTTHSAEILSSTKDDAECRLLHIINSNTITPIYRHDDDEAIGAIKALGVSTADLLFNKGVIYLEGATDEQFIEEILRDHPGNFKIRSLGGRAILEKEIHILQQSDTKNQLQGFHIFILDNDNKPTKLTSTKNVKVLQWDRYSFENYLLNLDLMYDVIKAYKKLDSKYDRTTFGKTIKDFAFDQIEESVVKDFYGKYLPETISLSSKELNNQSVQNISEKLSVKLKELQNDVTKINLSDWKNNFNSQITLKISETKSDWTNKWSSKCKGKELLIKIYKDFGLTNLDDFIKSLINKNKTEDSVEWQSLTKLVNSVINIANG